MMTTSPMSHNMTPNDVKPEQDMLLLAGSKISFRELYSQEIDLPIYKGKFYTANDVDNLFVIINGVLTSVSEQAYRNDKALAQAREAASNAEQVNEELMTQLEQYKTMFTNAANDVQRLQNEVNRLESESSEETTDPFKDETITDLANQLADKSDAYTRLLESSSTTMSSQKDTIDMLMQENQNLSLRIDSLTTELDNLVAQKANVVDTGLQSDYDVLNYKYNKLKTLSAQRIQELSDNKEISKELV